MSDDVLERLRAGAAHELRSGILPFWERYAFDSDGWVTGIVTHDLRVIDDVPRHSVLVSRILWTFAAAARVEDDAAMRQRWLAVGEQALRLLLGPFWDAEHGGVYWSLGPDRSVLADRKQTYAQAFAVYGLAEWYAATGDREALERARALVELVEGRSVEPVHAGYLEARARDWGPLADMALSDKDLNVPKSMNTHLHVLEAWTRLLQVAPDGVLRQRLAGLLDLCLTRIVAEEPFAHCRLFFDDAWVSVVPTVSYGHDIEASWLLWEAALTVDDDGQLRRTRTVTLDLADAVLAHGVDPDGAVLYEGTPEGVTNPHKHWWPQAEGVVGWLNAWELAGSPDHLDAAVRAWDFLDAHVVDHALGEWYAILDRSGAPLPDYPEHPDSQKIGPWKCPYHNARACLEVLRRIPATRS